MISQPVGLLVAFPCKYSVRGVSDKGSLLCQPDGKCWSVVWGQVGRGRDQKGS